MAAGAVTVTVQEGHGERLADVLEAAWPLQRDGDVISLQAPFDQVAAAAHSWGFAHDVEVSVADDERTQALTFAGGSGG